MPRSRARHRSSPAVRDAISSASSSTSSSTVTESSAVWRAGWVVGRPVEQFGKRRRVLGRDGERRMAEKSDRIQAGDRTLERDADAVRGFRREGQATGPQREMWRTDHLWPVVSPGRGRTHDVRQRGLHPPWSESNVEVIVIGANPGRVGSDPEHRGRKAERRMETERQHELGHGHSTTPRQGDRVRGVATRPRRSREIEVQPGSASAAELMAARLLTQVPGASRFEMVASPSGAGAGRVRARVARYGR